MACFLWQRVSFRLASKPSGFLLFAYSSGYVVPLLLAASATGAITKVMAVRRWSAWVTPASGALLITGGTYTLLSRLV